MADQAVQLLGEIALLCDDAGPVCQTIRQCLYRQDGIELQRQFRRLDSLLDQLGVCESRLFSLMGSSRNEANLQAVWAEYVSSQPPEQQGELRKSWGDVRAGLSLLHSRLTGLQVGVELRRQLLHNFVSAMQKLDESVNYSAQGQVQEQAGSGAMLNRRV